jgi:hypothetical protein
MALSTAERQRAFKQRRAKYVADLERRVEQINELEQRVERLESLVTPLEDR